MTTSEQTPQTNQERELELAGIHTRLVEHNQETLAKIVAKGAQLDGTFGLAARIEALVEVLIPAGAARAHYMVQVELHLGLAFEQVLEQLEKQSGLYVPGPPSVPGKLT